MIAPGGSEIARNADRRANALLNTTEHCQGFINNCDQYLSSCDGES